MLLYIVSSDLPLFSDIMLVMEGAGFTRATTYDTNNLAEGKKMKKLWIITVLWAIALGCAQLSEETLFEEVQDKQREPQRCEQPDSAVNGCVDRYTWQVTDNFESGEITRPPWAFEGRHAEISTDFYLSGSQSCMCYLPVQLYENARSELRFHGLEDLGKDNNYGRNFPFFTNWGIHFAIYVPENFKPDPHREIWAQFHGDPDSWDDVLTPPFALLVDQYDISIGIRHTEQDPSFEVERVNFKQVARVTPGDWHHFVIDLHWDYRRDGDGFCRVYLKKNGWPGMRDLIADYAGPMGYNDAKGPYFKLGIYKWSWSYPDRLDQSLEAGISERRLYYDDVVIRDAIMIDVP